MSEQAIVFRPSTGIIFTGVAWMIAAIVTFSIIASGEGYLRVAYGVSAGWFAWLLFWRPAVVCFSDRVVFRNILRDVSIPYALIDDVDTRFTLSVSVGDKRYSAWGAPAPGKGHAMRVRRGDENLRYLPQSIQDSGSARPGDLMSTDSGAPATMIRRELAAREHRDDRARHGVVARVWRVDLIVPSIAAVIIALGALATS